MGGRGEAEPLHQVAATNSSEPSTPTTASLTAAVLSEEAKRQAVQAERAAEVVLPDDLLPGVGLEPQPLRETIRQGGWATVAVVVFATIIEQFGRQGLGVLAPNLQETFGVSDTQLIGIASFGGVALVLGAVPVAWLADRMSRRKIVSVSAIAGAVALAATGLAANPFQLFCAFTLIGFATAYSNPVFGSLISDQYPIEGRSRIFALYATATPLGLAIGPFLAGGLADLAGGTEGWRWVYLATAVPAALIGVVAWFALPDPPRGQHERALVLGEHVRGDQGKDELPITISTAYQRLKKVKTFYYVCLGIGVLGLALVAVPIQLSLLLEEEYGYGAFTRGWVLSAAQLPAILAMVIAGYVYDRTFRRNPEGVVRLSGWLLVAFGAFVLVAMRFHSIVAMMTFYALAAACTGAALVGINPIVASVAPFRLRSQAFAIIPFFTFLIGGFLGGLVAGALSDAHGERTALTVAVPVSAVVGGGLFVSGSRHLKRDISVSVEELLEEQRQEERMAAAGGQASVLQVRNLDFSYGSVQVLFDVNLDLERGETLAVLGTNGAGKSTLLRAVSGLGIPDRGVVRLNGQTITYVEAEARFLLGIVQLRGGAGVFPNMTVADNLRTALLARHVATADESRSLDRVLPLFPSLGAAMDTAAGDLSGGQQQMLALAMVLVHEPELLIIDELSLGLAPVVVEQLLAVIGHLKANGTSMIIVEQSLNVAIEIADRAVFMEKGRVQFTGPPRDLLERGDLAKAVFLGGQRD
ncbi:ATP-binding protein [Actinospongicola halichondriae]|uniref:ATP-binding protein n=1 Tax=Actinospongicola halichondriae TaxID=3236844 RepID=UPI003D4ADDAF